MTIPRVKICGVKRAEHVEAAVRAGAAALGINFVPASKRFIGTLETARVLMQRCAHLKCAWAGVFVNSTPDELFEIQKTLDLDILQLHGDETPGDVAELRKRIPKNVQLWKAFRIATREDLQQIPEYRCEGWVLDAKVPGAHGGSGIAFDWSILETLPRSTPLILSGGLTPANVAEAIARVRPEWVDVASGVESAPGEKSAELIEEFVRNATA